VCLMTGGMLLLKQIVSWYVSKGIASDRKRIGEKQWEDSSDDDRKCRSG